VGNSLHSALVISMAWMSTFEKELVKDAFAHL
jgi:hypothetical protein